MTDTTSKQPPPSLGFVISDVARLIRRNFNRRVQHLGLTQAQWQVLAHLARNEGIRQIQLADVLDMQPISVAWIIDRMEAAGWVERRPDPLTVARSICIWPCSHPILTQMWEHGADTRQQALQYSCQPAGVVLPQLLLTMRENLSQDTTSTESELTP
ncbi:MAG: MarR family transcriptional regulator [Gammaproteobacteria bacterium]